MEQIIITKQGNIIKKTNINNTEYNHYFQFENLINQLKLEKFIKYKNEIKIINTFIKNLLPKISDINNFDEITSILQSDNIDKEILNLYKNIISNYDNIIIHYPEKKIDYVQSCLEICTKLNKEIIIKIIVKELTNLYTKYIINNISLDKLNIVYMMVIRNEEINNILNELNININDKYSYILEKSLIQKINNTYVKKFPHLCWLSCENTTNCDKMDDRLRKTINNYDFITSGYQIIVPKNNNKYKIDTFYVSECKNYKTKTKTRTNE